MKSFNTLITIVLVLSFFMGIYCAGTSMTYDFKKHLESISTVAEEMPHIEELGYIWTADTITNDLNAFAWPQNEDVKVVHLKDWKAGKGFFGAQGIQGTDGRWYTFDVWFLWDNQDAQPYWVGWEPITGFVEGVADIAGRVVYSFRWLGGYVEGFFILLWKIIPTSGLVERGSY